MTNLDLVAQRLNLEANKDDLILMHPWFCGVTLHRYYKGGAEWLTLPPLADYRIVEKMFTLPPDQRIRGNVQKYLLKKVSERYLPRDIVHRPKAPFNAPLRAWMRGPLAPMVDELLSESSLKTRGFYHPPAVRALIANDRRGVEDHGMVIWTLLTTEMWFRAFFDRSPSLDD